MMKKLNILILSAALLAIFFVSFTNKTEIAKCFISFSNPSNLKMSDPERLPETSEKSRPLKTDNGEVAVTRIDGYRILYNNDKNAPFVNVKVELSEESSYESDQKAIIENLKYLNAHSKGMETKDLIELEFNGYKVSGLSRGSIETGSTLGIFEMFPGNGVTIYFYFNNIKPELRHFSTLDEYKKLRDKFMDEYTKHLTTCKDK